MTAGAADPLVSARGVRTWYPVRRGLLRRPVAHVQAVDGVDLDIHRGETLGLVGESGCGKSTLGRTLIRLTPATAGTISFAGSEITRSGHSELKRLRRDMQIIFQDPFASLNPKMRALDIVGEGLAIHKIGSRRERTERVFDILERVGLRREAAYRYPHEFSGGQRQRIGIARALVLEPKFIVADEPVSALDVSIQSQVINLLVDLKRDFGLTYLFVAHNLAAVGYISDRIAVMYLGKVVELAPSELLLTAPQHPYTRALLSAVPDPVPDRRPNRIVLRGDVSSPIDPPSGCRFRLRCPLAQPICATDEPVLDEKGSRHFVACHFAGETAAAA